MRRRGLRTPLPVLANRLWAISLRREAAGKGRLALSAFVTEEIRGNQFYRAFLIDGFIIFV